MPTRFRQNEDILATAGLKRRQKPLARMTRVAITLGAKEAVRASRGPACRSPLQPLGQAPESGGDQAWGDQEDCGLDCSMKDAEANLSSHRDQDEQGNTKEAKDEANNSDISQSEDEFDLDAPGTEARMLGEASAPVSQPPEEAAGGRPAAVGDKAPSLGAKHHATLTASIAKSKGNPYILWPTVLLQRVCTRRNIRGMSNCKEKPALVQRLMADDRARLRESPHYDDLDAILKGEVDQMLSVHLMGERDPLCFPRVYT